MISCNGSKRNNDGAERSPVGIIGEVNWVDGTAYVVVAKQSFLKQEILLTANVRLHLD